MPRTTKHLKPHQFKAGNNANPNGRPPLDPAQKALRKLTVPKYREVVEVVITGSIPELKALAEQTDDALKAGIARAFLKAISKGDYDVIERIAERIIGRIPEVVEVKNTNLNVTPDDQPVDVKKMRAALRELEDEI